MLTEEDENVELPTATSIKALNPTIAYANDDKEIVVVPGQTGEAKFEVKFNAIEEPVTVTVDVKAARKPASIKEDGETFRIEAKKNADLEYTVLDQYGEETDTPVDVKVLDTDEETVATSLTGLNLKAGTYTVEFKSGNDKIGSFTVTATDVEDKAPDNYTLTSKNTEVDIKKDEDSKETEDKTVNIDINAFIEDTKLTDFETSDLKVKVSDENVAEVEIPAGEKKVTFTAKVDSVDRLESKDVVVTLYTQEGDLITTHDTITITVKNSIEPEYQVTDLSIKDGDSIVIKENPSDDVYRTAIVDQLTTGDDDNMLVDNMIDEVVLVNKTEKEDGQLVSGDLVITMNKNNGGKVFSFPVKFEALNLASVEKETTDDGKHVFTIKGEGYDLGRLHVLLHDGSLEANLDDFHNGEGKVQYLVVYASEDNVYGSTEAENTVNGFGVEASYTANTKTWELTITDSRLAEALNKDLNEIGLLFNLSNSDRDIRSNVVANDFTVGQ